MFGRDWEPGEATIIATRVASAASDGIDRDFMADVRTAAGDVFRAKIETPTIATDFWDPQPGAVVKVLVHPKSGKVKFDKSDPQISARAHLRESDRSFAELSAQPPDTEKIPIDRGGYLKALAEPGGATDPRNGSPTVEERLETLTRLHEGGILTDAEYVHERQRIIEGI